MPSSRIAAAFDRLKERRRVGLIPYLTAGFPDVEATLELVPALAEGGASVVELGVPFSDPLADGPTIQRASFHALRQGVTLATCIETVARLRRGGLSVPVVFMGYYNPFLSYGLDAFAHDAAEAGLDGVIVPDLPTEESGPLRKACRQRGLAVIPLLAPTSTDERVAAACAQADGFIYCVSLVGVTGARDELPPGVGETVGRMRKHTDLPIAVGFGISRREHVDAVGRYADAAVVGSALISALEDTPRNHLAERARGFVAELVGRGNPVKQGAGA